ncbi:MAG: ribose 5-phosphate isomerase B [Planctomycetota bacterium]|jgi:ribose 5-phosphate isomerase B
MKIYIGSDHAGYAAKEAVKARLAQEGHELVDAGTDSEDSCDYPDFALQVAHGVSRSNEDRGILICGTGIGMSIAANKIDGIRAALCHDEETARMSRAHNDANILCMGARILSENALYGIAKVWLSTSFEAGRHARRLEKIQQAEREDTRKKRLD